MKILLSIIKNIFIAFDQALNCCFRLDGEWGMPDETLSARAWRVRGNHPRYHHVIDLLLFWDRDGDARHCELAYRSELLRKQYPLSYRGKNGS